MAAARFDPATAAYATSTPAAGPRPARARRRPALRGCVLLVDSDRAIVETFTRTIRAARLEVVSTLTGREALALAHRVHFDLLLLHLRLGDIPALDVVRALRSQGIEAPFIAIVGDATDPAAIDAMALGAHRVLEEPIRLDDLRAAVVRATRPPRRDGIARDDSPALPQIAEPRTPSERWCRFVMSLVAFPHDLKTTADWARCAGVSRSVIREACRQVHIHPHDARDFARMLRAVHRCGRSWTPESVLDVGDGRTLNKLEVRSGLAGRRHGATPSIETFLDGQQWIPHQNAAFCVLRTLLLGGRAGT